MADRLFDVKRRERWTGSKALAVLDPGCAACGGPVERETIEEPALLRHGGHGATRRSVRLHCACGWSLLTETSEVRPSRSVRLAR